MGTVTRRLLRQDDGTELIEMALVMPVFVMLLFGIFSFAIVLFGWCNLTFAARAAARYASLHSGASLVPATTATIQAVATPFLPTASGGTTTVSYSSSNVVGSKVSVTVSATYGVTMPFTSYTSFAVSSTAQRTITR